MPTPITPAMITSLMTGYRGDFQAGMAMAPSQYQQIAMTVPSTSKSNTYGWLGQFPQFREWIGSRVIEKMKAYGYSIVNKTFEGTVAINRDDFEDDNLGIYSPLFQEMGRAAAAQPDELVFAALRDGVKVACYDGQNFFDTEHPVYPKVDGTGDVKNVSNKFVAQTAEKSDYTGPAWYLLDCSRAVKPLIYQDRRKAELVAQTKVDEGLAFTDNEFVFGASARRNVGYGFWQMAYMMQAPLTLDNLWLGWSAMREFTADGGRKLGIKPTHIVVPTSLEKQAVQLLERELFADGNTTVSNEMKGKLQLLVADYL
ncbi:Mu-like prophage major head subunit gpT family protein [Escherichia coli]|nr:Mu-like prophage major head subunit gpT family protein [Escherichia coli]HDL7646489.1 Mu-like prophage major head subunit gpT family protein [Yersinia enterocolitica]